MAISCSNCGSELPDDARFCSECGTTVVVEEKKPDYCANCFAELSENAKFCLQCGKPAIVATTLYSVPERDKSIHEELRTTSPMWKRHLAYKAEYEAFQTTRVGSPDPRTDAADDFEQNEAELAMRARRWAEYEASGMTRIHWFQELVLPHFRHMAFSAWMDEKDFFPTTKPNHHKALFYKEFFDFYLYELRLQGVLTYDDPPKPYPLFLDYLRKVRGYEESDIEEFELDLTDMKEIRSWPQRDDELFPPPQPIRAEVAGTVLNFTTDEGALIVYLDCSHKGRTVEIADIPDNPSIALALSEARRRKAEIIERSSGDTTFCAAIFNNIPFVLDYFKHIEKVLQQIQVKLRFIPSRGWDSRWEETIAVFRGNVTELDWRGRKG